MNTSKEDTKKAAAKKTEEVKTPVEKTDDLANDDLTAEEIAAMDNIDAAPEKTTLSEDQENDIFAKLENKDTEFTELTANYIELDSFKDGEERAYICTGKTTFTTKDGEVKPAVTLLDKERKNWICASTVIVNSLLKVETFPVGCKILYKGKKKSAKGTYHDVQVFVL